MALEPIKEGSLSLKPKLENPGEIIDDEGEVSRIFARITDNSVEFMARADTKAEWVAAAKLFNLLVPVEVEVSWDDVEIQHTIPGDKKAGIPDTYWIEHTRENIVTETQWVPDKGVHIDEIGPIATTKATYDMNGKELTPAVWDNCWHVNFRVVVGKILNRKNTSNFEKWKVTGLNWTKLGTVEASNKSEAGRKLFGVTLLDPETIATPHRGWQG